MMPTTYKLIPIIFSATMRRVLLPIPTERTWGSEGQDDLLKATWWKSWGSYFKAHLLLHPLPPNQLFHLWGQQKSHLLAPVSSTQEVQVMWLWLDTAIHFFATDAHHNLIRFGRPHFPIGFKFRKKWTNSVSCKGQEIQYSRGRTFPRSRYQKASW